MPYVSRCCLIAAVAISISVGTLDLIECGPAAEEGSRLTTTSRFILSPGLRRRRGDHLRNAFLKRAAEHDEPAHINGMLATSYRCRSRYAVASAFVVPPMRLVGSLLVRRGISRQQPSSRDAGRKVSVWRCFRMRPPPIEREVPIGAL